MTRPLLLALAALAALAGWPAGAAAHRPPPVPVDVRRFPTAAAALTALLAEHPDARVLGVGEYHELEGGPKVASSIKRFTDELLPLLAPRASDLVVETWITQGQCGKQETKVVQQVEQTTERPASTEDEVVTLLRRGKERGLAPHVLTLGCDEYAKLQPDGKEIDYVALLTLLARKLGDEIGKSLDAQDRPAPPSATTGKPKERLVLAYGGAIHNALAPRAELADFSYARRVSERAGGRYVELDVFVPEYIARDKEIPKEAWYRAWRREMASRSEANGDSSTGEGDVALVRRGPRSYVIVFAPTPAASVSPAPPAATKPAPTDGGSR